MGTATKSLLIALLTCVCAYGQFEAASNQHLSTSVSDAEVVTTVLASESVQLVMADGTPVGEPVEKQLAPVVKAKSPAKVLSVKKSPQVVAVSVFRLGGAQDYFKVGESYVFAKPGLYDVLVQAFGTNVSFVETEQLQIVVGNGPQPPPGPTPPGPTPPRPSVAPIEGPGLRVLMIVESGEPVSLQIQDVLYGRKVRDYLAANCIKVDGVPDWRIVDPDTKYTDTNHRFVKALARPRASTPWLIISNGFTGYEGPFPGGPDATLDLIKSFVGDQPPSPQPATVATVAMYTVDGCLWCDKWKSMEQAGTEAKPGLQVQIIDDTANKFSTHPTFVISKNGRSKTLVGYQTADKLAQEASSL